MLKLVLLLGLASSTWALNNGVARTPPMGWISWQRFRCNIDCQNDPQNCISERLYMDMADHMAADGYKDVGYQYIDIDDCWALKERDPKTMELVPDPTRFPSGMKALADYVHSKGLKLGTYGDMGTLTCGGYPGSKFTMETDANTFARWGIDSFKMDGCYSDTSDFATAYPIMSRYLNATGRPILFSCSWPAYEVNSKTPVPYASMAEYCNTWRNYDDIADSWDSVMNIVDWFGNDKWNFSAVQGPGNFNDPDMIIVGNRGLSQSQAEVQMAMWAIMGAPLYLSADLRNVTAEAKALMQHKAVIAINQDPLGLMGSRLWASGKVGLWYRQLAGGNWAMAVLNENDAGAGITVPITLPKMSVSDASSFILTEVFSGKVIGTFAPGAAIKVKVDVSSVFFGKLTPA